MSSFSAPASAEEQTAGLVSSPRTWGPTKAAGGSDPRPEEEDDWLKVVDAVLPEPMECGRGQSKPLCEQHAAGTDDRRGPHRDKEFHEQRGDNPDCTGYVDLVLLNTITEYLKKARVFMQRHSTTLTRRCR